MPPAVSPARIEEWISRFAAVTEPGPGVTRPGYSALERRAHQVFADHMWSLGLSIGTDAAGNTIAELVPEGSADPRAGAIGTGSHLDSVPGGGRFDGTAGVVAAMEAATVITRTGLPRRRPWRFVVFAAEEGARFGQACNGSRIAAGLTTAEDARVLRDSDGITMHAAMEAAGLQPDAIESARWDRSVWSAFVELHIEQGGVLEEHGFDIGVVDSISGSTRLEVTVAGQASHTGGTPMQLRKDALVTAAGCVLACDEIARDPEHHGTRITVGRMSVEPGTITTIPGRAVFTVDIRDIDSERQRRTAHALAVIFGAIAASRRTEVSVEVLADTSPVVLSEGVAAQIVAAADAAGASYRVMPSGASHDTQQVSRLMPAGMIFVPSRGGLSHVPDEFTPAQQIAVGTQVLVETMIRLDGGR